MLACLYVGMQADGARVLPPTMLPAAIPVRKWADGDMYVVMVIVIRGGTRNKRWHAVGGWRLVVGG